MKLSVITPLYNGKRYVNDLILMISQAAEYARVHRTGHIEVEYILVNDSPWEQLEEDGILKKAKNSGINIIYICNDSNSGIHKSRVNGVRSASGEYIMFLDQDDEIPRNSLASLMSGIQESKNDVIVGNGYRKYPDGRLVPLYESKIAIQLAKRENAYIRGTDMIFSPGQCLIKRKSIPAEWMSDILEINGCDDFYLWLIMLDKGCSIKGVWENVYYHVESQENYSNSSEDMNESYMNMCSHLERLDNYPDKKVRILRRRQNLKRMLKSDNSMKKQAKIALIMKNIDVILMTLLYKMAGYR